MNAPTQSQPTADYLSRRCQCGHTIKEHDRYPRRRPCYVCQCPDFAELEQVDG